MFLRTTPATHFPRALAALLLLFTRVVSAQEQPHGVRVPFHSANALILLDVKVNEKPAVMLFDTGAQTTVLSPRFVKARDSRAFTTVVQGVRAHASLMLSSDLVYSGDFHVADFAEISKQAGTQIDGLLGQNILRDFSAIRIDYRNQVVELEGKK